MIRSWSSAPKTDVLSVAIDQCRHYNGYKYGAGVFNPYENYVVGLHQGTAVQVLRANFEDFLRHFRPKGFGELLGVPMSTRIPLWVYPWHAGAFDPRNGWMDDVDQIPDIITHFCHEGIRRSRIDEEYCWLERAYLSVAERGYQPQEFSYVEVFELQDCGNSVFVVTDGNHRLSALAALGHTDVKVKRGAHEIVDASVFRQWPRVLSGDYTESDARTLISAYQRGVTTFTRSSEPATILDA